MLAASGVSTAGQMLFGWKLTNACPFLVVLIIEHGCIYIMPRAMELGRFLPITLCSVRLRNAQAYQGKLVYFPRLSVLQTVLDYALLALTFRLLQLHGRKLGAVLVVHAHFACAGNCNTSKT